MDEVSNNKVGFPDQHALGEAMLTTKIVQIIVIPAHDIHYKTSSLSKL